MREDAAGIIRQPAADGDDRHPVLARRRRDTRGRLAESRLEVDTALAGECDGGALHVASRRVAAATSSTPASAWIGKSHQTGANAAAGAGARPVDDVGANVPLNDVREVREVLVEPLDHLLGGAFSRAVDARGALFPAQRISES